MVSIKPMMILIILGLCLILECGKAELPRFEHPIKPDGSLSLLVVGDWGRRGLFNQSQVAAQMGKMGEEADVDFIVSTGDNFYDDGLTGINDPAFEESFTNVYLSPSLQKQWYIVLGNHDYRGDVLAQLDPILTQKDKRWFCMRSYVLNTDVAEFFFLDTTPFSDKYFSDPDHTYDWRGILPREEYLSNLLKDLDTALKQSTSNWKIVIGHHTIRSGGYHGNTVELENRLLPILQVTTSDN
ncbi:OLC1v1033120C1 [Oldenlandia corymbosa var. corymbosa]|uniref:OLC1v1033120C1 n=1 Tax=Oldenlandia corymbosa var. corymbosa TaxID=529605 RepID=A0AAV1CQA9_OLDCO|nr:OLC1v1033120C1 [Oldenlandia corymbosa var. corymbosa]